VAFVPFGGNDIGWVPLAPGDVYVPHYYNTNWQPQYLTRDNLYQRVVNLNVPNAVTVVSVDDFNRGDFDWRRVRRADRNMLASANPVLDPLLVTPLRNAAVRSAWGRGKIDLPPGIARKLNDTAVISSTTPVAPRFRPNLARDLRVNTAPDRAKGQKFKVRDERQGRGAPQTAQTSSQPVAPQQQVQPQPGNGSAQREQRRMEQQQRQEQNAQRRAERAQSAPQAERAARPVRQQQPQGERVASPGRQRQEQRRIDVPQQRPQPQMRRESAPVRSQPAPPVRQQQAPRAQPQPRPAAPPRAQQQERQQKPQKPDRPAQSQPAPGGGKGKGPKKP
jgi:hypothetical protein